MCAFPSATPLLRGGRGDRRVERPLDLARPGRRAHRPRRGASAGADVAPSGTAPQQAVTARGEVSIAAILRAGCSCARPTPSGASGAGSAGGGGADAAASTRTRRRRVPKLVLRTPRGPAGARPPARRAGSGGGRTPARQRRRESGRRWVRSVRSRSEPRCTERRAGADRAAAAGPRAGEIYQRADAAGTLGSRTSRTLGTGTSGTLGAAPAAGRLGAGMCFAEVARTRGTERAEAPAPAVAVPVRPAD
jgi:hypothetical protein